MNMKHKITTFLALTLISLTVAIVAIVAVAFRDYGLASAKEKAIVVSELVRDGLTVHMVNGIMPQRAYFMEKIQRSKNIENLWVVRANSVINQFGAGMMGEKAKDTIDAAVLEGGAMQTQIDEDSDEVKLRVTIPYTSTAECVTCHESSTDDVLGAVSMIFDITDVRYSGIKTIVYISVIALIVLAFISLATSRGINRYLNLFEDLSEAVKKGHEGDFSPRITTNLTDEGGTLAKLLNDLYELLSETVNHIDKRVSILLGGGTHSESRNPLTRTSDIVDDLVAIYKFKKTIEVDRDKKEVYDHIATVVREHIGHCDFALFEVLLESNKITLLQSTRTQWYWNPTSDTVLTEECRALRTGSAVFSDDALHLCKHYDGIDAKFAYMCLPYRMTAEVTLLIQVVAKDSAALDKVKGEFATLTNYLESARPVLETHYLMSVLQDTSLRDALTGLYNRKFLDEYIDRISKEATRSKVSYGVLSLDLDFFKMVNDTYGHDIGDVVIKGIADTIRGSIREADVAVRNGGEEFLVLLMNTTEEGALRVAEKIRETFAATVFNIPGAQLRKTVSAGVAIYPSDAGGMWRAIKCADVALYKAKESGRNLVVRYTPDLNVGQDIY
jgi:diguanylate cyclase (GGDEF)-like protein